jgi:hypothetical protein
VPSLQDDVSVQIAGTYTVTLGGNAVARSLTLGGSTGTQTLWLAGKALVIAPKVLDIQAKGALKGPGNIIGTIRNAGTVTPNVSNSYLNIWGSYSQTTSGALNLQLDSTTQFDRLGVLGIGTLAGALSVATGFSPSAGDTFVIVRNFTNKPITGTFTGLPEGATFASGGNTFQISYVGGAAGHDVVLTSRAP